MYQADKRIVQHHARRALTWVIVSVAVLSVLTATGFFVATHYMKPNTIINNKTRPIVNTVIARTSPTKKFTTTLFTISLPDDWKFVGRSKDIYEAYVYQNTADNPGAQTLEIYVDNIPTTLGVNRVLPVESAGNRVIANSASANCSTFTGGKLPGSTQTPAKWAGVHFLCDLGNYERNVIGTSSPDTINSVTLDGKLSGQHNVFFTYADNSAEPNDQLFYDALQSFRLN